MKLTDTDPDIFLRSTPTIDYENDVVEAFVADCIQPDSGDLESAVSLYYAVRDRIRYDPYGSWQNLDDYSAPQTLKAGRGWCIPKAIVYAACCRWVGIPARLGFANVRNHLSTEHVRRLMGTDIFYWHGYTAVYLNRKWIKATPAFNIELCEKFRLKSLDFNGKEDSIYHPFDLEGQKHMEYLHFHGEFADLPFDRIISDFTRYYPDFAAFNSKADFDSEVALETSG
jgi:transglutaminase-like putative cysteine protease